MTPQCSLCGNFESEETSLSARAGYVCYDCLDTLIENEIERRGVEQQIADFRRHHEGQRTGEDVERDQLRDAGRGHLT
jgi:hypothetical protein